jgi:hypothetical protein
MASSYHSNDYRGRHSILHTRRTATHTHTTHMSIEKNKYQYTSRRDWTEAQTQRGRHGTPSPMLTHNEQHPDIIREHLQNAFQGKRVEGESFWEDQRNQESLSIRASQDIEVPNLTRSSLKAEREVAGLFASRHGLA